MHTIKECNYKTLGLNIQTITNVHLPRTVDQAQHAWFWWLWRHKEPFFMDLEIERYMKSQNQIIQRDLQIGVYQRAEAKLSQVSATRSGSCKRTEESPNIAREKAPGNMTTNYDPEFTKVIE